jgi:hypothetical protein
MCLLAGEELQTNPPVNGRSALSTRAHIVITHNNDDEVVPSTPPKSRTWSCQYVESPNLEIKRLNFPVAFLHAFDVSDLGCSMNTEEVNDDGVKEEEHIGEIPAPVDSTSVRIVPKLSLPYFRGRLLQYFDILFCQDKI